MERQGAEPLGKWESEGGYLRNRHRSFPLTERTCFGYLRGVNPRPVGNIEFLGIYFRATGTIAGKAEWASAR